MMAEGDVMVAIRGAVLINRPDGTSKIVEQVAQPEPKDPPKP